MACIRRVFVSRDLPKALCLQGERELLRLMMTGDPSCSRGKGDDVFSRSTSDKKPNFRARFYPMREKYGNWHTKEGVALVADGPVVMRRSDLCRKTWRQGGPQHERAVIFEFYNVWWFPKSTRGGSFKRTKKYNRRVLLVLCRDNIVSRGKSCRERCMSGGSLDHVL